MKQPNRIIPREKRIDVTVMGNSMINFLPVLIFSKPVIS
jgi:hypothetical protein